MKKLGRVLVILLAIVMSVQALSFGLQLNISGEIKALDIVARDGRTYVDASQLSEYGVKTKINEASVLLTKDGNEIEFYFDKNHFMVNETKFTFDGRPFIEESKAYIPIRVFFDTIGYKVTWDNNIQTVVVKELKKKNFPLIIKDSGKTYIFKQEAKRIVSLAPSVTETLYAIGAGSLVAGRTNYCNYPKDVMKLPSIGTLYTPDLEKIVDLNPDLVIAASHMNEEVMGALGKGGIATLTQATPKNFQGIYDFVDNLGHITGKKYEARALVTTMLAKSQRAGEIKKSLANSEMKRMYYVVGTGESEWTAGNNTFINEIIQSMGAINVATDVDGYSYTIEKLIDRNPEILIGNEHGFGIMRKDPRYAEISGIKNNKYIIINSDVFSRPGPRVFDNAIKILVRKIYPERLWMLKY